MKIVTVVGARPQFVKAAMLSREMVANPRFQEVMVHTGQHYDANMSDIFFQEMDIPPPAYNLGIGGGLHGAMTGRQLEKIESILLEETPDCLLVYGDTNSTLAGALAAVKLGIPVAHVEAGLRNFDLSIPEDVNRVLTDRIASILFCSTDVAIQNLKREGFDELPCQIVKTGDLMADAFYHYANRLGAASSADEPPFVLCTIHRDFNTKGRNLEEIVEGLNKVAETIDIVFPVHPRTLDAIKVAKIRVSDRIRLLEPVGYLEMIRLLLACESVITDSGGLQREAYMAKKKSLLLLAYTPWEELVDSNCSLLGQPCRDNIFADYQSLSGLDSDFSTPFYGRGDSAKHIVETLEEFLRACQA